MLVHFETLSMTTTSTKWFFWPSNNFILEASLQVTPNKKMTGVVLAMVALNKLLLSI
jgi:hypothetical protein